MRKVYIIILSLAIIAIAFGLGFFVSGLSKSGLPDSSAVSDSGYKAGWEAAKQRLYSNSPDFASNSKSEYKAARGTVTQVASDQIVIKIMPLEVLADPELDNRIVAINEETKIIVEQKKSNEEYQQELEAFFVANPQYRGIADAPVPNYYKETPANQKDIEVGASVEVKSTNNIKDEKSFTASQIVIVRN